MAHPARDDAKHLDKKQAELVARTRHPGLRDIETEELRALETDLRGHRDSAQKGLGGGEGDAADNFSLRRRSQILNHAVKRIARERGRRDRHLARADLREFAADVMGQSVDKTAPKRGSAKGFAKAANRTEKGETGKKGRKSPLAAN